MMSSRGENSNFEAEESLLYSARHGELTVVKALLDEKREGKLTLDINCKGKSKSNLGWTPLHLATYFGHKEVVEALMDAGADVDEVNDSGDTALHKASFIGNEELVILLLNYKADVNIMNGEGKTAIDVCKTQDVQRLLEAAGLAERRDRERKLLTAAREGRVDEVQELLSSSNPPSINCVDAQGNTCLHCTAYRGHARVAVLLLQNGIDTTLRNNSGQLAIDLAKDNEMREVLNVRPVQRLQRTAVRFEGPLMKRSRFLGWRPIWGVLQRGVFLYYGSRAEAAREGGRWRDRKYLDGAKLSAPDSEPALLVVNYSDGDNHRLAVPQGESVNACRQSWITALKEHIAYSGHYLWAGAPPDSAREATEDLEDECKPLGSMQDALTTATNSLALLDTQLRECAAIVAALDKSVNVGNSLHHSAYMRFQHACGSGQSALAALRHCAALVAQARDRDKHALATQIERNRVLEEALAALARTHHALEMSVAEELTKSKRKKKNSQSNNDSKDNFYDVYEDSDDDTLVTAGLNSPLGALSPWGSSPDLTRRTPIGSVDGDGERTPTNEDREDFDRRLSMASFSSGSPQSLHTALSPASSRGTLVSQGGHVYRNARPYKKTTKPRTSLPVAQFSRGDFSLWSVLKNCVGKELSKITMPVVFNEPLSFLQRMLEYLEYAHLLRMASEQTDPVARMEYIAAFAVSALASNWERLGKPFNPLLGETYELERPEFRAVCEQVSHHPPVSAFHADSPHFVFHGSVHPKLKFCGKSVEIQPKGHVTVELPRWGEAYTWTNVNCCVHNVIVGKLWIEQYGAMEVTCHGGAGLKASLAFKPAGFNNRDLHRVDGFIIDHNKKRLRFLYGKWTEYIKVCSPAAYDQWVKERGEESGTQQTPSHTPKKVLAKLNSFKVGALRSMSIQDNDEAENSEDVPKPDESYNIDIPGSVTLWEARPRPSNSAQYYQFTEFAMSLNEMERDMKGQLCPTDSRLRPDIRLLEQGDIDGAAAEKTRLEEKQRAARKMFKKSVDGFQPRWFSQGTNPYTKQEDWLYNGGYWDRNYQHLKDVDIF
ncbi:oxysterol-binding protein-related protein 1 isoform X8 [Maniola jurtina]|uniref:oxysterol-binding protein-related protein 1 isoform X8 n=3 Tax=Maniola jurtina TaxID=191418 RepID=UPI001E68D198|nr:oxysterol-binding protein-related protein 1 isoform X8 [Maniola jurtina]